MWNLQTRAEAVAPLLAQAVGAPAVAWVQQATFTAQTGQPVASARSGGRDMLPIRLEAAC